MSPQKHKKAMVIIVWENPNNKERQVLMLERSATKAWTYVWQPVTGNGEAGEDFPEIALREAREETGLIFAEAPRDLGIRFSFKGRSGLVEEAAFALDVHGAQAPIPLLDPKEHQDFAWLSPEEAMDRVPFAETKEAIFRATYRPSPLKLSSEGVWSQDGEEITHARTAELLHQSLVAQGKDFVVRAGNAEIPVEIADSPLFVAKVDHNTNSLTLLSGETAALDPSTLEIGVGNILYCRIKGGWRARFLRPAYYELARQIREEIAADGSVKYVLHWQGRNYTIAIPRDRK